MDEKASYIAEFNEWSMLTALAITIHNFEGIAALPLP